MIVIASVAVLLIAIAVVLGVKLCCKSKQRAEAPPSVVGGTDGDLEPQFNLANDDVKDIFARTPVKAN